MSARFVLVMTLAATFLAIPRAHADEAPAEINVAVPGLRPIAGDDGIANELTGWLRAGTSAVEGWHLHPTMVSLEQLVIVHGCEDVDEACLSKAARALEVDGLVSGSLSRAPATDGSETDFIAYLFFFDADSGTIRETSTLRFSKAQSNPTELAVMGQAEVQRLAGAQLDELGREQARELMLSRDTELGLDQSTLDLLNDRPEELPIWPAAVSYGGTVLFLGLSAWSWTSIRNVERDPAFERARRLAGSTVSDVCAANTNFGVEELGSLCSKADRHETLQWVFLSMGLASAGVGTWLLVKSVKSKQRLDRARLNVTPVAGRRRGGITARLRF